MESPQQSCMHDGHTFTITKIARLFIVCTGMWHLILLAVVVSTDTLSNKLGKTPGLRAGASRLLRVTVAV